MNTIRHRAVKEFKIEFMTGEEYQRFCNESYEIIRFQEQYHQVTIRIRTEDTAALLGVLKNYQVKFISELPYTLEMHFNNMLFSKQQKGTGDSHVQ